MARTAPADVIRRLLDDDTIHEHMAEAGAGVRDAYRRARRLPAAKAVQDKTVYDRPRPARGAPPAGAGGKQNPPPPPARRAGGGGRGPPPGAPAPPAQTPGR